jgi:hypothetical protein
MDEKPLQLLGEARKGRRKSNGAMIQDSEYVRNGTCSITSVHLNPLTIS